jgi:photosystem II biogenesis protein Psp29
VSNVRTVSDTKRAFYRHYDRPVTSVYRRVIEELMVEMHLLSVSEDFVYDPLYALGIVTTFDTFMEGYRPEGDSEAIFAALCQSIESSAEQYRQDAQHMLNSVEGMSLSDLQGTLANLEQASPEGLPGVLKTVAQRDRFKYSRAFGIGLYTLVSKIDSELTKDKEKLMAFMKEVAEAITISFDKLQKDIELYRSNLDKMVQAKALMAEVLEAERKKRAERAQAQAEKASSETVGENGEASAPVSTPATETDESHPPG